jgi:hypothetical protein
LQAPHERIPEAVSAGRQAPPNSIVPGKFCPDKMAARLSWTHRLQHPANLAYSWMECRSDTKQLQPVFPWPVSDDDINNQFDTDQEQDR